MNTRFAVIVAIVAMVAVGSFAVWYGVRQNLEDPSIGQRPTVTNPTFTKHIAPIVLENCTRCHRPGESAPFDLISYQDVQSRADQIADVTRTRYMPPWLPAPGHGEFVGQRRLSPDQIELFAAWARNGTPEGDPADLPTAPIFADGWQLGEPDLIVSMDQPYTLPADGPDVFRNFVLPIPISKSRYIRAFEFRPGSEQVVHHSVILVDRTRSSRALDAEDDEPGFEGMERTVRASSPDGFFLGWTPGKLPNAGSDQLAWKLEQGSDFVVLLHMLPSGKPERVQPSIGLFFADKPPSQKPVLIKMGSKEIDIPAGKKDYLIRDVFSLPTSVRLLDIYPHAHYLGKRILCDAELPNGDRVSLIRIDDWDFNWQDSYRYSQPVRLPAGTRIVTQVTYDNSSGNPRNPSVPPRRVVYGPQSTDEMCSVWIQALPERVSDTQKLSQAVARKSFSIETKGYSFALRRNPQDAMAHNNMGAAMEMARNLPLARQHWEAAARINPKYAAPVFNLGVMYMNQGDRRTAAQHFERVVSINSKHTGALVNLGSFAAEQGNLQQAAKYFRRALQISQNDGQAYYNLGVVLVRQNELEKAADAFQAAIRIAPDDACHANLGVVYLRLDKLDLASEHLTQAIRINPRSAIAYNSLGVVRLQQGRAEQAGRLFQNALAIKPDYREAEINLQRAQAALE